MTAAKQTKQTRRHNAERGSLFSNLSRVVVKVGTRILSKENHHLDKKSLGKISGHVAEALGRDIEVILVTSGSVGSGMGVLGLKSNLPRSKTSRHVRLLVSHVSCTNTNALSKNEEFKPPRYC